MNPELYFSEPRLQMTIAGRLLVRAAAYTAYAILLAATVLFLASDVAALKLSGVLTGLFLIDRWRDRKKGDRSLAKLSKSASGKINAAKFFSPAGFRVLEWALDRAVLTGKDFQLLLIQHLIGRSEIESGLLRMDVKPKDLLAKINEFLETVPGKNLKKELAQEAAIAAKAALLRAVASGSDYVEPKDIFSGLGEASSESITKLFRLFEINKDDLENALILGKAGGWWRRLRRLPSSFVGFIGNPYRVRHRVMNRAWTAKPTPFLDQFSQDLTDLARMEKIGFLIGHEAEYDRLSDVLARPGRPNALLIGDPGVGKETLAARLAFQIVKDRVPAPLFDKRLVKLEVSGFTSGASETELSERISRIINEIILAGNIILYIPDIHNLLKTAGPAKMTAADMFLPAIKSSAFSVIGATYPREFKDYVEKNTDFLSAFEAIRVNEISEPEAVRFLVYDSILLEQQYKILITFGAVKTAVQLAHQHFRSKPLPSSAEDLLKEALTDAVEKKKKTLAPDDVISTAERKTNVPIHRAGKAEAEELLNLEKIIHQRLVDQEEAVKKVAQALREYRSGLSRKGGPIAAFLFVGPTGVGKTELSKILAGIQFGSKEAMVRFDMSEYQEKSSISRLIDSLAGAILEKPYSLVLLDEFEKAHPDLLNLFLQVFDDGRLTDTSGRAADFQNTIIIATSNAHSDFIKSEIEGGKNIKAIGEELKKKLTDHFRPELLNRFSGIIVFKNLSRDDLKKITYIQLQDLAKQLQESNGIDIQFDDSAVGQIIELGYDPVYGARPLRGVISDKIKGVLAEKILKGEIGRGSNIKVSYDGKTFRFS